METVLHNVYDTIEDTLDINEYVLATFLNIDGAYNNVNISSILAALQETGGPYY